MSLIKVSNLTFAYDGSYDNVFEKVNFQIDTDWKLGFLGRNGRGKTTFLNLLMKRYSYKGSISSTVDFQYFPYEVDDENIDTINIMQNICPQSMDWEIMKEVSLLDLSEDVLYRPFCTLSKGEQTKILLAALFLKENNFLLIDEPTNHLDMEARKVVGEYLKKKKGFILVSHDRSLLDECVDHVLSINKMNIEIQKGNFQSWWDNKILQDNFELATNEKLKKEIKRLTESAKRGVKWSDKVEETRNGVKVSGIKPDKGYITHKSAKAMKRAKNIEARQEEAISQKSELLHNIERSGSLKVSPKEYFKETLVNVNNLDIFYGEKQVCSNVSFRVDRGDRIALRGKNGSGKSSILKLLCGETIAFTGDLTIGSKLKISYVSQDTSNIEGSLSDLAKEYGIDEGQFKTILNKLDFKREQFEKNIENFSDGQKKKVLIARSLCEEAHLYIWDEPLNYIDVLSRIQIENLLMEYGPTILFVEHDKTFCNKIANKVVQL